MSQQRKQVLYFENFDLDNIITPVDYRAFERLLNETSYDTNETKFITEGFRDGFSLEYQANEKVQIHSRNLKLSIGDETDLWNKVMKEVKMGRYAGPFKEIPHEDDFIQSPIGLVPKDQGKDMRLIFHLSYPRQVNSTSVNANTPKHLCTVQYPSFSDAMRIIVNCLNLTGTCYLSKSDAKSAFRNLGILRCHWRYLIMTARSPLDQNWYFFIDKCLPFGAAISCSHFQRVSNAIAHIVKCKSGNPLVNYLDDYLFVAILRMLCNGQLDIFLKVCQMIGMPVALEKTVWGTTQMVFLGFLIDTVARYIAVPQEKLVKARNLIEHILDKYEKPKSKWKITIFQLEKIRGFLNFLGRAVVPGRAFTRRLYSLLAGNNRLKQHHHIRITSETFLDLQMWRSFLQHPAAFFRPFSDFDTTIQPTEIGFYMDASRNFELGFGGTCLKHGKWMQQKWPANLKQLEPSIQYLELYAQVAGVLAWGHFFQNSKVLLHCDNNSVVSMINETTSTCCNCMVLIRILTFHCLVINLKVVAEHIVTQKNEIADSLSRFQYKRFNKLTAHLNLDTSVTPVPEEIWPPNELWLDS